MEKDRAPVDDSESVETAPDAQLDAFLRRYGSYIRGVIARVCPRNLGLQIGEIEQEARIRIWRALKAERNIQGSTFYLYKIAATATIDAVRQVKARREDPLADEADAEADVVAIQTRRSDSPEQIAVRGQVRRKVDEAIAALADNRRLAVGLYLQGFTSLEIAHVLGWSEPKARNLTHRGLKDLRARLREAGIDYAAD